MPTSPEPVAQETPAEAPPAPAPGAEAPPAPAPPVEAPPLPSLPSAPAGPPPPDAGLLPVRGQRRTEEHWYRVDRRGVGLSRVGLVGQLASTAVMTTGLVLLGNHAHGDAGVQGAGIALTTLGTMGALGSGTVYLLGFGRSERGMRERGVAVGDGLLPVGWITYGSAAPLAPLFVAAPPTLPLWSIAVMGLGAGVGTHQRRVRDEADLPDVGSPWTQPVGAGVVVTRAL